MYGFALRMYDQCLGRWHATDPYEQHWLPYLAMSNNPVSFVDPDGGWDGWYDRNSVTYFVDGVQVDGWEYEGYFKNSPPGSTLSMMGSMFAGMSLPVLSFSQDRGFGMWLNEKDMVAYGLHANFNTGTGVVAAMDYDVVSHFFGINNVGHYGLSNTLIGGAKSVAEFSGGVVVGIGEGAWGTVKGLGTFAWGLVSNSPVENGMKAVAVARGIGSAVYNYDKTWSAITASVSKGVTEFVNADAYGKGKVVGHVVEAVLESYAGAAAVNKLRKYAEASMPMAIIYEKTPKVFYRGGDKFDLSVRDIKDAIGKDKFTKESGRRGISANTNPKDYWVQEKGKAFEIDLKTVPDELEFKLMKGTHYEIVPRKGLRFNLDEYQGLLNQIQVKNSNTWPIPKQ